MMFSSQFPGVYLSKYLSVCLSIYLSIDLFIYLSICLSVYLSIYLFIEPSIHPSIYLSNLSLSLYIYIWVNYNISLTWIKAIWGWFPLLTMIPVRSQWGRYNLPRYIYIYVSRICVIIFACSTPTATWNHPKAATTEISSSQGSSGSSHQRVEP